MKLKKYITLKTQIRDQILIVTLNRPEVRNALNQTLVNELTDVFSDPDDYTGVTNIIITGAGPSFCAGADLSYLKSLLHHCPQAKFFCLFLRQLLPVPGDH